VFDRWGLLYAYMLITPITENVGSILLRNVKLFVNNTGILPDAHLLPGMMQINSILVAQTAANVKQALPPPILAGRTSTNHDTLKQSNEAEVRELTKVVSRLRGTLPLVNVVWGQWIGIV